MNKINYLVAISRPFFALLLDLKKLRMLSRTAFVQMTFVIINKEDLVCGICPEYFQSCGNLRVENSLSCPVSREKTSTPALFNLSLATINFLTFSK